MQRIPADVLAEGRGQTAARRRARLRQDDPGVRTDLAGGARRHAAGRRAGVAVAARRGQDGPQGAGRTGRAGDPPVHADRPDALRQGPHRRAGRQAGRDRLRERRPDAAQLRGVAARFAGGNRHGSPRRRPRSPVRGPADYVPQSAEDPAGEPAAGPARFADELSFTAPAQPGVYPYVCTYPGHWRRMYGALYVVEDLDEYLRRPGGLPGAASVADRRRSAEVHAAAQGVEIRRPGPGLAEQARVGPVVRQRQADVPGGDLRRLPQAERRRQASSGPT